MPELNFACPYCHTPLNMTEDSQLDCPHDGLGFKQVDGIWRFLLPDQEEYYTAFSQESKIVLKSQRIETDEKIDNHVKTLIQNILIPLENQTTARLLILDLGAGTGWLADLLTERGHLVGTVDLLVNSAIGLGAAAQNKNNNPLLQAEFNAIPVQESTIDLIIYNDAFHYSDSYVSTLGEAYRVLKPEGQVVIMGTPYFEDKADGVVLIKRQDAAFEKAYGFPRFTLNSEGFLTEQWLDSLADLISIKWDFVYPNSGKFQQKLVNYWRKLLRMPIHPTFPLIIGKRDKSTKAQKDWSTLY